MRSEGVKLFSTMPQGAAASFKFVSLIFQCTGGGTLVPIFINSIPVALAQDAYPIAIMCSFLLHQYVPILREVYLLSPPLRVAMIVMYETMRASVVVKLTSAAGKAIAPSEFNIAVFGPIFCGTIGGCGGAFLPLDKGLSAIKDGLGAPMISAFIGATFYHLFTMTALSEGVMDASKKAHIIVAVFFIVHHLHVAGLFDIVVKTLSPEKPTEKETKKTK